MTQDGLRAMLVEAGLGRVADVIVREARPSIRITAHAVEDEDTLPLGASKFGGSPDLPPGMEWPLWNDFPLAFVAQINLAEVAPSDVERILPPTGLLYFYYDHEHWYSTPIESSEMWRIQYFSGDHRTLVRTVMPPPLSITLDPWPIRPCGLTFTEEITLPDYNPHSHTLGRFVPIPPLSRDEAMAYYEMNSRLSGITDIHHHVSIHRMLGYADPVQNDLHTGEKMLVLQVDTDDAPGTDWGDTGRIYYFIDKQALAQRDFEAIRFETQDS